MRDSHVTPSLEVLHRYASAALKERWSEFSPYTREMNSPAGRGHPTTPWNTLKINPIPYNRIAGYEGGCRSDRKGRQGRGRSRVVNTAKEFCQERIQHDNPHGRLQDMDTEGVDVNLLIPGTLGAGLQRPGPQPDARAICRLSPLYAGILQRRYQPPEGHVPGAGRRYRLGGQGTEAHRQAGLAVLRLAVLAGGHADRPAQPQPPVGSDERSASADHASQLLL